MSFLYPNVFIRSGMGSLTITIMPFLPFVVIVEFGQRISLQ